MRGPLLADIEGLELSAEDGEFLRHPAVGGVVLFARNYRDPAQLRALTSALHALHEVRFIIAVDQEGGRVQRFVDGFTVVPSMGRIGAIADIDTAADCAYAAGLVLSCELRASGVDLTFAPVLDVDRGLNDVIGARSFGVDPARVMRLANDLARGLNAGGLPAVGKHFPGHGAVSADSHFELPVDLRAVGEFRDCDLLPFAAWATERSGAVMTAHIHVPDGAPEPATFSPYWVTQVLRGELGFDGLVFTDDLGMAAARLFGSCDVAAEHALEAGCDAVLVCNDRPAAIATAEALARNGLGRKFEQLRRQRAERLWALPTVRPRMTLDEARMLLAEVPAAV